MKTLSLTLGAVMLTTILAMAESSTLPEKEIQILREEIHRQELIVMVLKEKLATLEKEIGSHRIKIEIDETGIKFKGKSISAEDLKEKIKTIPKDESVTIVADPKVPFKKVTSVLDSLKHHGIFDVSIAASKSEPVGGINSESLRSSP